MDGFNFVSKLRLLNLPNTENLRENDFDWVFLEAENKSLSVFWDWFFSNINPEDVLSEEELLKYEELLSSGLVLSEKHLNQIETLIDNTDVEDNVPQLDFSSDDFLKDDLELMKKRLQRLNTKKDILSLQKLELEGKINKKQDDIQRLKYQLELEKREVDKVCSNYSSTVERLSDAIQNVVKPFQNFQDESGEENYVSQLSNEKWREGEVNFKESLFKYIYKQFQEGADVIVGSNDTSCYILDMGHLDNQFVRGPKQAEYSRNVKELNRISVMLEETEVMAVECELNKAQKEAEMIEALKFLKSLDSKTPYSLPVLKESIRKLQEKKEALELDIEFQTKSAKEQAVLVSQIERLRVISGNYEVKLKRQDYICKKQDIVYDFLLGQLSRLDLMKIIYDIEKKKIKTIFDVVVKLNHKMAKESEDSKQRLDCLEELKSNYFNNVGCKKERETLCALLSNVETPETEVKEKDLNRQIKEMDICSRSCDHEIRVMTESQMNELSKLFKCCSMLEDSLFETSNSMNDLPDTWIDCSLIDRQAKEEQTMWELQQEMFQVLKDYEKKKKMTKENSSIQKERKKWIPVKK